MSFEKKIREHLQQQAKELQIPVSLDQEIKEQIKKMNVQRKENPMRRYSILVVAVCLILISSTVYAISKGYKLFNQRGEVVLEYKDMAEGPVDNHENPKVVPPAEGSTHFMDKVKEIEAGLEPGTAALVYVVEENPDKIVVSTQKPLLFGEKGDFQEIVGNLFSIPDSLAGGYDFAEGRVYQVIAEYTPDEVLYQQAEETGDSVIIHPIQLSDQIDFLAGIYRKEGSEIRFILRDFSNVPDKTIYTRTSKEVEKIQVDGLEILYIKGAEESGEPRTEVRWMGEDDILHTLIAVPEISKEEVAEIVKELKH